MNISKLSLKALRDQIMAGTREVRVLHKANSGGTGAQVASDMVYIPRFRVPAGIWDNGAFPGGGQDMLLGGFFCDKYPASQPDATAVSRGSTSPNTPGTIAATSQQGVVPWTNINQPNAKIAATNRIINGRACHLAGMHENATISFLTKLLGHDIRGNNSHGRDHRNPNAWEYQGNADPVQAGRTLVGTGPVSWAHNGLASGVFDIVGNVWEWLDFEID